MNLSHHSSPLQLFHISLHSSNNNSLFITIPIIAILATVFLLISYYTFVIKCFLNPHLTNDNIISSYFNPFEELHARKGLEEYIIRSLPIIKFQKVVKHRVVTGPGSSRPNPDTSYECSVCLNEFVDGEKLRVIPICCHAFHIDCIDIWLQSNASCPLCRSGISPGSVLVPGNNSRILSRDSGEDDGFVVFEILGNNNIGDEPRLVCSSNNNEMGSVVGDEWIDIKGKDCEFRVDDQLTRRSISMDLSIDREFLVEIQRSCSDGIAQGELCSNGSGTKLRR